IANIRPLTQSHRGIYRRHQFVDEEQVFSSSDGEFGCRVLTIGWSSSLDKMRAAAPSIGQMALYRASNAD
ncbi:MAG: hypothetical protein WB614_08020, partial [Pseudolabrys sp.]